MTTTTTLKALLLLAITVHFCTAQCREFESYFQIEIAIEPTNPNFDTTRCDSDMAKTKLRNLTQRIVDKKFDAYLEATQNLIDAERESFCGGQTTNNRRGLAIDFSNVGWHYSSTSKCRFCLPDVSDSPTIGPSRFDIVQMELQDTLERKITRQLTQKVNKSKKQSCLSRGSNSNVTVVLTPVGSQRPDLSCPEQP